MTMATPDRANWPRGDQVSVTQLRVGLLEKRNHPMLDIYFDAQYPKSPTWQEFP